VTNLEAIVLRRADEQVRGERLRGYRERDSWDVPEAAQRARPAPKACRAGCGARAVAEGLCRVHVARLRRGLDLDADLGEPGRKTRG
jgi:hypothetical protein